MTAKYRIEHIDGIDEVTLFEQFAAEEFMRIASSLNSNRRLYEFTVSWNFPVDQLKNTALSPKRANRTPASRVALVNAHDLGFGMGRIFESYLATQENAPEMRVFRSKEEAREWLKQE